MGGVCEVIRGYLSENIRDTRQLMLQVHWWEQKPKFGDLWKQVTLFYSQQSPLTKTVIVCLFCFVLCFLIKSCVLGDRIALQLLTFFCQWCLE